MSAPEKCPKCGSGQFADITEGREFICFTLIDKDEILYEGNQCLRIQRDKLAERVKHLMWIADGLYDMATESGWESTFQRKFKELKDNQ